MSSDRAAPGLARVKARWHSVRPWQRGLLVLLVLLIALVLLVGSFPASLARPWAERRLAARFGAPVSIGSMARSPFFSFSPRIILRDVRIAQPGWAGPGDLMRAGALEVRVPLLPILFGRGMRIEALQARDVTLALVREASGRANWKRGGSSGGTGQGLSDVSITNGRFTLKDGKRFLTLAGHIDADRQHGLILRGEGRFRDSPASLVLTGPAIPVRGMRDPYPVALALRSPLLTLDVRGIMAGALNMRDMTLQVSARAPSLKYLDDIIEAGLFGSQPIDLTARLRHNGRDWTIERIAGRVGRSLMRGRAQIDKRDGRTKVDADIVFSQLDFDDLADDEGLAEHRAMKVRIGPRVLPDTRVNLSKVGPTDGTIRFTAQRLLFRDESVFRSLRGTIRLDHKRLSIDDIEAGLTNGRMTGRLVVDHRTGASPLVDMDLQFRDGRLGPLLDASDKVDAPFGARIALAGRGDTLREALARSDGHVGLVAGNGHVSRLVAAVLAQDMGKTIGAALGDGSDQVPLRCIALGFAAKQGRLTAAPFLIETAAARSRGEGAIDLDGERIALAIGGTARKGSGLPIVDPIRIGGTLSQPSVDLASTGDGKGAGGLLGAVVKSIGGALGLTEKKGPTVNATGPVDCAAVSRHVLRAR
ncbi:AsmA family protein [Sphingobium nicotianae]|uniref:AsmA family protein n=1 Tax=Sphingobium nicotianae TaxID=2782607 RepID=A0A9X1DAC5_9SPHN|nr:AsmA-like C-terminal region-containing protein [Sphingobium nicotianae]MBT2186291.1 AsmA family protein [Sphingobium nicotianae]